MLCSGRETYNARTSRHGDTAYTRYQRWGFWGPRRKTNPWLENADSIYYPAVICKGDFQLFFVFFIVSVFAVLWLVLLVMLYVCVIAQRARVFVVMASLYR